MNGNVYENTLDGQRCGTWWWTQLRRKAIKLEMVTQLTAALFTGSALFIAQIIQQGARDMGRERERKGGGIMAVLILGSCGFCPAKCGLAHTHFDNVSWAHSLYIKGPTTRGLTFVLGSMKKEKTLWCLFPSGFIWLRFCCGGEVCSLCVTSVYSAGSCYCMLERLLFGLFVRLTDCLSMLAVYSTHLIGNAVVCSCQMAEDRMNEKRKERGKHAWLVCCAALVCFNILCGI